MFSTSLCKTHLSFFSSHSFFPLVSLSLQALQIWTAHLLEEAHNNSSCNSTGAVAEAGAQAEEEDEEA